MNQKRWAHIFKDPAHNPPWCMDWRHVRMINAALAAILPARVVEIGTYQGASTSAIIEAMEQHPEIEHASLIDYQPIFDLKLAGDLYPERLSMINSNSADVRDLTAEFWILDGDHDEHAFGDLVRALQGGARTIVVHDINTHTLGVPGHKGSWAVWNHLLAKSDWVCFWDKEGRADERTSRGIGFAFYAGNGTAVTRAFDAMEALR